MLSFERPLDLQLLGPQAPASLGNLPMNLGGTVPTSSPADSCTPSWTTLLGLRNGDDAGSHSVLETLLLNGLQGLSLVEGQPAVPPAALGHSPQLATSPFSPATLGQQQQPPQQQQQLGSMPLIAAAAVPALAQQGPPFIPPPSGHSHLQLGAAPRGQPQLRGRKTQQQQQQQDYEKIRRTVYVCDIDQQVSETELAGFFLDCGAIIDYRLCGDPNSSMRFAFIEFQTEAAAQQALTKSGSILGMYQLRISPSKTAIVPVKRDFLPTSHTEREAVERTIYVANIDKMVERDTLHDFFSHLCGPITKLRLLGDAQHSSKIAFVEFESIHSAKQAANCSGVLLGSLPLRISPSKTPVRLDTKRSRARSSCPPGARIS